MTFSLKKFPQHPVFVRTYFSCCLIDDIDYFDFKEFGRM